MLEDRVMPLTDMPLTNIVAAAQQGDKRAFDQLVVRFQDMAYASAYAILGDAHLAQDAAQDAFLDAYQNLGNLREPAAFPGWFRRIVLGRSHRHLRAQPVALVSLDTLAEVDLEFDGRGGDPLRQVEQHEAVRQVDEALTTLSPALRLAVALYYIEGYSQQEIADYLETPTTTVKKRLHDARKRLKERMMKSMQQQIQANRPSQNDDFARRVHFFTAVLAGDQRQVAQLLDQDHSLLTATVEWKMALKSGYWPLGSTALHLAVGHDDRALAEVLLERGAPIEAKNVGEITPLHLAAIMQRSEMARLLLDHGAEVNARTQVGQTALHHAALRGDHVTLQVLLDHKADVSVVDREGHRAVDLAAMRGDRKSVDLLLAHGASAPTTTAPPSPWPHAAQASTILQTGIKAVDLLAPIRRGGIAGHFTPLAGVGFSVLLAQYVNSVRHIYDGTALYLGLESYDGHAEGLQAGWQEVGVNDRLTYHFAAKGDNDAQRMKLVEKALSAARANRDRGQETLLLIDSNLASTPGVLPAIRTNGDNTSPAAITTIVQGHHTVGVLPEAVANLDSVVTFSGVLARLRLYPAVDPVRSTSRLLDGEQIEAAHRDTARTVRRLLQRYMDLHPVVEAGGIEALWYIDDDPDVQQTIARARRLQRFLTQPFYGAEPWTGLIGQLVPLAETIKGCQAILRGDHDALPEEAFLYTGTVDEVVAKARQ